MMYRIKVDSGVVDLDYLNKIGRCDEYFRLKAFEWWMNDKMGGFDKVVFDNGGMFVLKNERMVGSEWGIDDQIEGDEFYKWGIDEFCKAMFVFGDWWRWERFPGDLYFVKGCVIRDMIDELWKGGEDWLACALVKSLDRGEGIVYT